MHKTKFYCRCWDNLILILGDKKNANLVTWFPEDAGHSDIKYMYFQEFSDRVVDFFKTSLNGKL